MEFIQNIKQSCWYIGSFVAQNSDVANHSNIVGWTQVVVKSEGGGGGGGEGLLVAGGEAQFVSYRVVVGIRKTDKQWRPFLHLYQTLDFILSKLLVPRRI